MKLKKVTGRKVLSMMMSILMIAATMTVAFAFNDAASVEADAAVNNNYRVIAYVTQWNWPGVDDPMVDGDAVAYVDASTVTHINYAFGHIVNAQGSSYTSGFTGCVDVPDPDKLHALVKLKEQNPDLKVLLSVGGWGMDGFCPIVANATYRKNFVNSCIEIMQTYGLDGIDLDYEYPGTSGDKYDVLTCNHAMSGGGANETTAYADGEGYLELFRDFRNHPEFGWNYLLTIASGVGYDWNCSVSTGEMGDWLDFINIMCYDLYGDWTDHSDYNANLYPANNGLSYDVVCKRLAMRGYPKDIINVGIPIYGRDRTLGKGDASWLTYDAIQELLAKGLTRNWDSSAHASYATGTVDGRSYNITYDDAQDIQEKCAWIQESGFGGGMYWEYSQDFKSGSPMTKLIWDQLNGSGRKIDPPAESMRYENTTGYPEWKSYKMLADNPDGVFFQGKVYEYANKSYAGYHQGTYGWVPTFAPAYATSAYYSAFPYANTYGDEWVVMTDYTSTTGKARNEAGKTKGAVKSDALKVSNSAPSSQYILPGATASWDIQVSGGSGSYTITNQVWFNGLKYDVDGYVKYEKRRTGGPYPNSGQGGTGETMSAISCTNASTSSANHTVSATFANEGTYYIFTQVTDSAGSMIAQFTQPVTVTSEIPFALSVSSDKTTFDYVSGDTITWTATLVGENTSGATYTFEVFKDGVSVEKSSASTNNVYIYSVPSYGTYKVKVTATNGTDETSAESSNVVANRIIPLNIVSVTASSTSIKTGTAVTFTCEAEGGKAPYSYSFYFLKDGKVYQPIAAYSRSNEVSVTFTESGTYTLRTYVQDMKGTRVVNVKTVTVA